MLENHTPPILLEDLGMLYPTEKSKRKYRYGLFLCQCGKEFKGNSSAIATGITKSCGCLREKMLKEKCTTHGKSNTRIYYVYNHMKMRTTDKNYTQYKDYGGRGISICEEWKNNPKSFIDWAMKNGYDDGLTIDRINNDGNYEPNNCRWTTRDIQSQNTRLLRTTNKSGYRGVNRRWKKWISQIQVNYNKIHIGLFNTAIEAAQAYDNYVTIHNLEHTKNFS